MVDNSITFGAHIGFRSRNHNIIAVVPSQYIVTFSTVHKRLQYYKFNYYINDLIQQHNRIKDETIEQ